MKKEIKAVINNRIKTNELNLRIFTVVRNHVKKLEGKKYTRRYLADITTAITKEFGSTFFKYGGASLDDSLSWKSIKLDPQVDNGYSHSYQLHYDSEEFITIAEFDRLNQCWSLDSERNEKLRDLLKDNETLNKISKSIKAINKANEELNNLFEYGENASEIEFRLRDLLDVKLERK